MRRWTPVTVVAVLAAVLFVAGACAPRPVPVVPVVPTPTPAPTPSPTSTPVAPSPEPTPPAPTPTVTPAPTVTPRPAPSPSETTLDSLAVLPNRQYGWGFVRRDDHTAPRVASWISRLLSKHDASYRVATTAKVVYLTFDEGYENGYTARILDTLADRGVHVVFFCTGTYIRDNTALVKRMVAEGHVVANHTWDHANMVTKARDFAAYRAELTKTADRFKAVTGASMSKLVRMPSGNWSERALAYNDYLGYRTYFWSFAYRDWETGNQPDPSEALDLVLANTHPGEIMLLHAVSKTNTSILGDVIDKVRSQGYRFEVLPH